MTELSFPCDGKCPISIVVDIQGRKYETKVLIDTGFTSATGYGLKLDSKASLLPTSIGYDLVRLADNRLVRSAAIPDSKLLAINGKKLGSPITLPTPFFGGPEVIGMQFIQTCKISIDGPSKKGKLKID